MLGQFPAVSGVVGAGPGHDRGAVPYRLDDRAQQAVLLLVGGGRRFAGGATDDQAVVAHLVDQIGGEAGGPIGIKCPVSGEGRDHRGQHPAERRPVLGCAAGLGRGRLLSVGHN